MRLVGAAGSKGRLEVYHDGIWGTVCDNGFTDREARVICYMLGHGRFGRFISNIYGPGSGRIWLDNVRCSHQALYISACQHNGWGNHSCQHSDDVSVSCIADSAEAVALVGGGNPRVGRLEVFHANQWGTVCDDGFTDAAARVVCYSLGFGYIGRKVNIDLHDEGDGLIWLDNVKCDGTERYIGECSHDVWGVRNCSHNQDIVIACIDNKSSAANTTGSTTLPTRVRLVGGSSSRGRLEVLHNGVWGTVCGDYFTYREGRVICKMLGFAEGKKIDSTNYTTINGPIWLDNLRCSGTERDIADCSHKGWGVHNCHHRDDVAVSCLRTKVEVRLNGGRDPREGRLEVFYNGVWGTACSRVFSQAAARVVCHMLGFGYIGQTITNNYGSATRQITMNSVHCSGTEENIAECERKGWQISSRCNYVSEAISCLRDGAVALFGGGSPLEGRMEVYHNGIWGSVCDDGFTDAAAKVVCYSLGFGRVGHEANISLYSIGRRQIWLDDIQCSGSERHISECSHRGWGVHNCGHSEDVAVSCDGDSKPVISTLTSIVMSNPSASDRGVPGTTPSSSTTIVTSTLGASDSGDPGTIPSSTSTVSSPSDGGVPGTTPSSSTTIVTSTPSASDRGDPGAIPSPTSTVPSPSNLDVPGIGLILIIIVVIIVLLLIVSVIIVVRMELYIRRNPRQERTEVAMVPMPVTASANDCDSRAFDTAAFSVQASNDNIEMDVRHPSAELLGMMLLNCVVIMILIPCRK